MHNDFTHSQIVLVNGIFEKRFGFPNGKFKTSEFVPLVQIFAVFSSLSLALERTAMATASPLLGNWLFFDFTLSWLTLQLV